MACGFFCASLCSAVTSSSPTSAGQIACPICAEPAPLLRAGYAGYLAPTTYDIHECDKCDLQFASPFKSDGAVYEAIYRQPEKLSGYDRYFSFKSGAQTAADPLAFLSDAESMYWFVAHQLAERNADRSRKILEVGCGLGYLTHALRKAGHNVRGLDISSNAVTEAKAAFGDNYICADVNDFAAAPGGERFDFIVMTEVIEHLDDPITVLRALRALLKPGGVALVSTPSKDFLPQTAVWRTDNPPVHLAWYSKTSLREIARRADFRIKFADFREYNESKVAQLESPRDLASASGAFRISADGEVLDKLPKPRGENPLEEAVPELRRLRRRGKYVRRALELYAEQSEVLGAIFQRVD